MSRELKRKAVVYLEECGWSCLHCRLAGVVRRFDRAEIEESTQARPRLLVPCHCPACRRDWAEVYRLDSVREECHEAAAEMGEPK